MDDLCNTRLRQEVEKFLQIAIERLRLINNAGFRQENEKILQQIKKKMIENQRIKTSNLTTIKEIIMKSIKKTLCTWVLENKDDDNSSGTSESMTFQSFLDWDLAVYEPSFDHRHPPADQLAVDTQRRLALKYPRRKIFTQENCSPCDLSHNNQDSSTSALFKRRHEIYAATPQAATYGEHRRMMQFLEDPRNQSMPKAVKDVRIAETDPMSVQNVGIESNLSKSPPNFNNNNNIVVNKHQTDSSNGVRVLSETTKKTTHRVTVSECATKHSKTNGDTDKQVMEVVEKSKPIKSAKLNHKTKENHRELQDLLSYTTEILPKLGRRKSVSAEEEQSMQLLKEYGINQAVKVVLQRTDSRQIAHRTRSKSIDSMKYLNENPEPAKQTLPVQNKTSQRRESKSMEEKKQTTATPTIPKATKATARKSVSKPQNSVQSINGSNYRDANKNVVSNVAAKKEHKVAKPKTASAKRTRRSPSPHYAKKARSRINDITECRELETDLENFGKDSDEDKPPELLPNAVLNGNPQPNNDPKVHCHSDYMEKCCLCSYHGEQMVRHYVYNHSKKTVYVSRVAPGQAQLIRADPFCIRGRKAVSRYGDQEIIVFRCHFCDLRLSESQELWLDHISKHTGEYRYKCMLCPTFARMPHDRVTHHSVCTNPSMQLWHTYTFEENHLYAYMCNKCNFVQVLFVNMRRHFQEDHPEASSIEILYTKFSLVNFSLQDEDTELPYGRIKLEPIWDTNISMQENVKQEVELELPEICHAYSRAPLQAIEQEQHLMQPEDVFIKQENLTYGMDQCETNHANSIASKGRDVCTTFNASRPQEISQCPSFSCLRVKKLPGDMLSKTENNIPVKVARNSNVDSTDTTSSTRMFFGNNLRTVASSISTPEPINRSIVPNNSTQQKSKFPI